VVGVSYSILSSEVNNDDKNARIKKIGNADQRTRKPIEETERKA
jgi:hypothetical protein